MGIEPHDSYCSNDAINLLAAHCGSTVLLCTATQPLLQHVDETRGAAALAFKTANENFRVIQPTQGIVVPFGEQGK